MKVCASIALSKKGRKRRTWDTTIAKLQSLFLRRTYLVHAARRVEEGHARGRIGHLVRVAPVRRRVHDSDEDAAAPRAGAPAVAQREPGARVGDAQRVGAVASGRDEGVVPFRSQHRAPVVVISDMKERQGES